MEAMTAAAWRHPGATWLQSRGRWGQSWMRNDAGDKVGLHAVDAGDVPVGVLVEVKQADEWVSGVVSKVGGDAYAVQLAGGQQWHGRRRDMRRSRTVPVGFDGLRSLCPGEDLTTTAMDAYGELVERASTGVVVAPASSSDLWRRGDRHWLVAVAERAADGQVVLVPWHTPGHWTYGALRLADGEVVYHDSLGGGVGHCANEASAQLRDMAAVLCDRLALQETRWQVKWGSAAHQGKTRDCGVHVLTGMRRWALQGRSTAWRINGVDARMHIITELVRGALSGGLEPRGKCAHQPRQGRRERRRGGRRERMVQLVDSGDEPRGRQQGSDGLRSVQLPRTRLDRSRQRQAGRQREVGPSAAGDRGPGRRQQALLQRDMNIRMRHAGHHVAAGKKSKARAEEQRRAAAEERRQRMVDQRARRVERVAVRRLLRGQQRTPRKERRRRRGAISRRRRRTERAVQRELRAARDQPTAAEHTLGKPAGAVSTAGVDFIGDDVLFAGNADGQDRRIRGLTWNSRQRFDGAQRDAFLTYVAAQKDSRGERPGYDFCAVQEPGRSWSKPGMAWMWESEIVAQADEEAEWRRSGPAGRRRWKKKRHRLDPGQVQVVSRNARWRASNTDKVVLMWTKDWADRQMGGILKSNDGRTVAAKFSTSNGAIGVIAHYGVPAPKRVERDEDSAERNAANSVGQLLAVVDTLRSSCTMVMLLGDLNTQRVSDRLDKRSGLSQDAAEVLWRRTVTGGDFVASADALGHKEVWTRRGRSGNGAVIRTRPDWCLISADWARWRIARCGVHRDNHALMNSDHFPVGVEMASIGRAVAGERAGGATTGQPYDVSGATPAQMEAWSVGLRLLQWETPTDGNWQGSGRAFYDDFVGQTTALARRVFGRPKSRGGNRRPFWDKVAGVALREMAVLRRLRGDLRRLMGRRDAAAKAARAWVLRRARRYRNFPPQMSTADDG